MAKEKEEILENEENVKDNTEEGNKSKDIEKATKEYKKNTENIKEDDKEDEINKLNDMLLRTAAEFDNYKKRTQKEMVQKYNLGVVDTVKKLIDVLENLERALEACKEDNDIKKGIEMTLNQFNTAFKSLNVEVIDPLNEKFDPSLHNAVMHIEDKDLEDNTVCEVFQKGYKISDNVIRFAMVKVAN